MGSALSVESSVKSGGPRGTDRCRQLETATVRPILKSAASAGEVRTRKAGESGSFKVNTWSPELNLNAQLSRYPKASTFCARKQADWRGIGTLVSSSWSWDITAKEPVFRLVNPLELGGSKLSHVVNVGSLRASLEEWQWELSMPEPSVGFRNAFIKVAKEELCASAIVSVWIFHSTLCICSSRLA